MTFAIFVLIAASPLIWMAVYLAVAYAWDFWVTWPFEE